jgi:hypothetical protein
MTRPVEQVVIIVRSDGTVAATTRNVHGSKCLDYINVLEELLGAETVDSRYTADYAAAGNLQAGQSEVFGVQQQAGLDMNLREGN